jgi:hypothetical protein
LLGLARRDFANDPMVLNNRPVIQEAGKNVFFWINPFTGLPAFLRQGSFRGILMT